MFKEGENTVPITNSEVDAERIELANYLGEGIDSVMLSFPGLSRIDEFTYQTSDGYKCYSESKPLLHKTLT